MAYQEQILAARKGIISISDLFTQAKAEGKNLYREDLSKVTSDNAVYKTVFVSFYKKIGSHDSYIGMVENSFNPKEHE